MNPFAPPRRLLWVANGTDLLGQFGALNTGAHNQELFA